MSTRHRIAPAGSAGQPFGPRARSATARVAVAAALWASAGTAQGARSAVTPAQPLFAPQQASARERAHPADGDGEAEARATPLADAPAVQNADDADDADGDTADDARYDGHTPLDAEEGDAPATAPGRARGPRAQPPGVGWTIENRKAAHRNHLLSLGVAAWPTTLSADLWYAVPLLRRGLIPPVNDAFLLEFGTLLSWDHHGLVALWPAVGVRWDFYLTRRWATYFNLKFAVEVQLNGPQDVRPNAVVGFGGMLRLAERLLLRLELNYPQGLAIGLGIPIGPV